MLERRELQRWTFVFVSVAGGVAILFLPDLLLSGLPQAGDRSAVLARTTATVAAIAWAVFFAMAAFRRADEFNRERSKFAWYWGSLIGLAVATPIAAFVAVGGSRWLNGAAPADPQLVHAFALGVVLSLAAQVLGSAAVSLWWRMTRR
jgi:cell division protein FtsW (lipid II flippase)